MSFKRRVAKNALVVTASSGFRETIGFVVFLMLARFLGPEAYGIVGMAMIVVAFGQPVINESVSDSLVQAKEPVPGHFDTVFWCLLGLALAATTLVWLAADLIADLFDQATVAPLLRWLSIIFVLEALTAVPIAQLKRDLRLGVLAVRSLLAAIIGGVVGITMALQGAGAWSLVGLYLSQRLTGCVVIWASTSWRPGFDLSWRYARQLRDYSLNMVALRIVGVIDRQIPRIVIGIFLGPVALGHFSIAWRMLEILLTLLSMPLSMVAFPTFAHVQTDPDRVNRVLVGAMRAASMIALPSFAGFAVLAPEIVAVILGDQWLPTIPLLQLLCLLGLVLSQLTLFNSLIRALGRPDLVLKMSLLGIVIGGACLVLFIGPLGLIAVPLALLVRTYVMMPLPVWLASRLTPLDVRAVLAVNRGPIFATAVMVIAVLTWRQLVSDTLTDEWLLATSVIAGMLVYGGMITLVAGQAAREMLSLLWPRRQRA